MSIWDDETANMFKGFAGPLSDPFKSKDKVYHAFVPDLCR